MKNALFFLVTIGVLAGCGQAEAPKKPAQAETVPVPPQKDHNYVMRDGMKYGYPAAISENEKRSGQVAERLVMAMYAGEHDGKYQAHIIDGATVSALECAVPCEYAKIMSYIDNPYLRNQIKVEHIAVAPGSIIRFIMDDATAGKLDQYGVGENGKRYSVWVDEKKGMIRTLLKKQ